MAFSIFISHRTEDRFLARFVKSRLEFLSSLDRNETIECFVCEEIPGGAEWRQWMIDSTAKADCLLFIHTNKEDSWTWCASEIGQFDGYKRALKTPSKVLWFSIDNPPSFSMLAENQFYGISEDQTQNFLRDLFVEPTFGTRPLRPGLNVNHTREFNKAARELYDQFAQITRPEELFRLRLRIVLREERAFRQTVSELATLRPAERATTLLKGAILEAEPATIGLLTGPHPGRLDWESLSGTQGEHDNASWLTDLSSYIAGSFADASAADRRNREQVLSPIFHEHKLYQPVIARLEYLDNAPFSVVVIFVPMPPFSEDPRLMMMQGVPKEIVFLSLMLRLARRFRWTFLEPLYNAVADLSDGCTDKQWSDLLSRYSRCLENLASIERQGDVRELKTIGDIRSSSGFSNDALLKEMFRDWPTFQGKLAAAVEERSPEKMAALLEPWLRRNKDFMKLVLTETLDRIEVLRPAFKSQASPPQ